MENDHLRRPAHQFEAVTTAGVETVVKASDYRDLLLRYTDLLIRLNQSELNLRALERNT